MRPRLTAVQERDRQRLVNILRLRRVSTQVFAECIDRRPATVRMYCCGHRAIPADVMRAVDAWFSGNAPAGQGLAGAVRTQGESVGRRLGQAGE